MRAHHLHLAPLLYVVVALAHCGGSANNLPALDAATAAPGDAGDAAPDAPPDAPQPADGPVPLDGGPDAGDAGGGDATDATEVDAADGAQVDASQVEGGADAGSSTDAATDVPADVDPLDDRSAAVAVTVRSDSRSWSMARSQSCTVMGGRVSLGADFETVSGPYSFTASGPLAGPASLTMIDNNGMSATDVRATIQRGADYMAGGLLRTNVRLAGSVALPGRAPVALTLTALGCVVR